MEFDTDAQKGCYQKVAGWLKELYGDNATPDEDGPSFKVRMERGAVRLRVNAWGGSEATIAAHTGVVAEVEHKVELFRFLLRKNHFLDFGAFSLSGDGEVQLQYTLVGGSCDQKELGIALSQLVVMADLYDDEIIAKFGGKRSIDRVD